MMRPPGRSANARHAKVIEEVLRIADTRADMIRWSFVFWAGSVAPNFFLAKALLDR
jgi:hypothetical protein